METNNVIVTGAAGGIGRAICARMKAHQWTTVGVDLKKPDHWSDPFIECDLSRADCGDVVTKALEREGISKLHGLICNAGILIPKSVSDLTIDDWDRTMAVNIRSIFLLVKALQSHLLAAKGAVVNVASVHGHMTTPNVSAYACSKGAVLAFTRALAVEWGPLGIRVNAVVPGAIDTPMLGRSDQKGSGKRALIEERTPLGRIGDPSEVAAAVHFLVSEQLTFVTGQSLAVDGGALSRLSTE